MKISARNVLKGKVKNVKDGSVNSEVTVALPGGAQSVSVITKRSPQNLRVSRINRCNRQLYDAGRDRAGF
jgi:molybdopterin-binding protein